MPTDFGALRLASIFCFVCLNVLDVLTTSAGIKVGFSEGNPMMAAVLGSLGEATMYTIKMLMAWTAIAVIVLMRGRYHRLWYALHTANATLALVVMSNLAAVMKA